MQVASYVFQHLSLLLPLSSSLRCPVVFPHALLDVESPLPNGMTLLHDAIVQKATQSAQFLIRNGADVQRPTGNGSTPIEVRGCGGVEKGETHLYFPFLSSPTCFACMPLPFEPPFASYTTLPHSWQ